ncbi:MAG: NAD(P)-binding domain-containing protein [Rhodothermales bacterium]
MAIDTYIIWLLAIALLGIFVLPYFLSHRKREKRAAEVYQKTLDQNIKEPDTLHPVIDPNACICTGNCITACPEQDVLGLISGAALTINPTHCVGHGLCERACPVDAIKLVLGTAERGVDIPRIQENFETNVPGIYVIGELGGMGLIRTAFEQSRQCIEGIVKKKEQSAKDVFDVIVIGCGPAGLAASLNCKHHNLQFITIEKEDVGGTVRYYPRKKLVMTFPLDVPGYGKLNFKSIIKEDLIALWKDIIEKTALRKFIRTGEMMKDAQRVPQGHIIVTTDKHKYKTNNLILAIGRRGTPRKIGIPGEDGNNVAYSLLDPDHYQHNKIVVVGGGDSAIEAAVALAEQPGNTVRLSYRKDTFSRIKPGNQERIKEAITLGKVEFLAASNLTSISDTQVSYKDVAGAHTIQNEFVFIMIGGTLPTAMLKDLGIKIDTKFGEPIKA